MRAWPWTKPFRRAAPGQISVAMALVGGISALVVLAVGAVLAVGWIAGARNTTDLLADKSVLLTRSLEEPVRSTLRPAELQLDMLGRMMESGDLNPADALDLSRVLSGALASTPGTGALLFVTPALSETLATRNDAGIPQIEVRSPVDDPLLQRAIDEARGRTGIYWWEPVYVPTAKTTFVNVHRPVHVQGEFKGVLIAAVSVKELSRRASETSANEGVTSFIMAGERLLAHPALAQDHADLGVATPTVALDRVGDPVVAALPRATLVEALERTQRDNVSVSVLDDVNGTTYVVFRRHLPHFGSQDLSVVAYSPVELIGRERIRLFWSGLVGLGVLAVAVALAVLLGRGIGRPIQRMAESAQAIGSFDFDKVKPLQSSPIRELSDQAQAFNAMLGALRWFELYLPRRLVRHLMAEGQPTMAFETRTITVLFADIIHFTQITDSWPAERTAAMLNGHFATLAEPIEAEDGIIDKYMGDCLMAFWVASPQDGADTSSRAVRAAMQIAERLEAENARRRQAGEPLIRVRIGIHTGQALVGNIGAPGRINFTVVGGTVNVAQRLEQAGRHFDDGGAAVICLSAAAAAGLDKDRLLPAGDRRIRNSGQRIDVFKLKLDHSPELAKAS
jgi:adenylate cyclase